VECGSELCRGRTVVDRWRRTENPPNATVGVGIVRAAFVDLLAERLAVFP
jgi:inosine-uridine nucleoside N-ribohydrolase